MNDYFISEHRQIMNHALVRKISIFPPFIKFLICECEKKKKKEDKLFKKGKKNITSKNKSLYYI